MIDLSPMTQTMLIPFLLKAKQPSGITTYQERVEYVAKIHYEFWISVYKTDAEHQVIDPEISKAIWMWTKWPESEKIDVFEAFSLMFKMMTRDELLHIHKELCLERDKATGNIENKSIIAMYEWHSKIIGIIEQEINHRNLQATNNS